MPDITCSKCKIAMKKMDFSSDPNMDVYLCNGCGVKKKFPKKSQEKIQKEEQLKQLDKERVSSEGLVPEISDAKKQEISDTSPRDDEEKTQLFSKEDVPKPGKKSGETPATSPKKEKEAPKPDPSSEIKKLNNEIESLRTEIKDAKVTLKAREIELNKLKKDTDKFMKDFEVVFSDFKSSFGSKVKSIEKLLENFHKENE